MARKKVYSKIRIRAVRSILVVEMEVRDGVRDQKKMSCSRASFGSEKVGRKGLCNSWLENSGSSAGVTCHYCCGRVLGRSWPQF